MTLDGARSASTLAALSSPAGSTAKPARDTSPSGFSDPVPSPHCRYGV